MHTKSSFIFQKLVFHPNIQLCLKLLSSPWAIAFSEMKSNAGVYDEKQTTNKTFEGTFFQYSQLSISDKYFSINKPSH